MISVPAHAWRGGPVSRAAATGLPIGAFFGALAWVDSGSPPAAAIVFVVLGVAYGIWMSRRMGRYWPGASALDGADRVKVVRAARRGELVDEARLAAAVIGYQRGVHEVVTRSRHLRIRWLIWLLLAAAALIALRDGIFGSPREGVASFVFVGVLLFELLWWPRVRDQLLANADRAAELAAGPCAS